MQHRIIILKVYHRRVFIFLYCWYKALLLHKIIFIFFFLWCQVLELKIEKVWINIRLFILLLKGHPWTFFDLKSIYWIIGIECLSLIKYQCPSAIIVNLTIWIIWKFRRLNNTFLLVRCEIFLFILILLKVLKIIVLSVTEGFHIFLVWNSLGLLNFILIFSIVFFFLFFIFEFYFVCDFDCISLILILLILLIPNQFPKI